MSLGVLSYVAVVLYVMHTRRLEDFTLAIKPAFEPAVFLSTTLAFIGMIAGSLLGRPEDRNSVRRFHVILNTPIGQEQRLVRAGVKLPTLIDAGLVDEREEERLNLDELDTLYRRDAREKWFGPDSQIELKREPSLPWYLPGFCRSIFACAALVLLTWLLPKLIFA